MTPELGPPDAGGGMPERMPTLDRAELLCEVDLIRDDYWAWARYARRHQRGRVFWASLASYLGALGAYVAAMAEEAWIAAVLAIIAVAGTILMQKWLLNVSRLYTGRSRYVATRDGLTTEIEHVTTSYGWRAFERTAESADHFFLITRLVAVVVPKRGFASPDDVDRFRALLSTSIESD